MIRKALFNGNILHMELIECDLFMCIGNTLHILNMNGLIREDVSLPSDGVKEIFKHKGIVFLRIDEDEYYYFRLDSPILMRIGWDIEKMHANNNAIFSCGCSISSIDLPVVRPRHIVTMPGNIIDFAEVGPDIYVLLEAHLCLIQNWHQNREGVLIRPVEFLSHLKFVSMASNGSDFIILESNHEVVVYGGRALGSIRKSEDWQGLKVFSTILVFLLSDSIELYCPNTCKMLARLNFTPKAITYDSYRKRMWLYSDVLYEIDTSKLTT
ncbi:putative WD40 domain-containing protein [Encephalitozoon cuniculi]|nr:putative WD40 domain-containing protein [Encephalitozoon cuniculi]